MKFTIILVVACSLCSCGKPDYNVDTQNTRIESYLSSLGVEDYYYNLGAYRYTYHTGNGQTLLEEGDSVYIYYTGYIFSTRIGSMFTTNILQDARDNGFDTRYIERDRYGVRLGDGNLLRGLELGLPGSREGDSMYIFMASDLGYDDEAVGIVEPGSSLAFKVVVDEIVK
ncbi:MAG: FKBP-type peptidyl-prolyl cis-trans isomerase [Rikenellaceae bacterium]|nr:FKBP-type peptidyl-prolyl cis-trans isomerase [Rikenellaceae bacterium]